MTNFYSETEVKQIMQAVDKERDTDPFDGLDTIKVFVATPSGGQVDVIAYDNHRDIIFELGNIQRHSKFRFFTGTTGRMMVTYARETIAEEAVKLGMDWILFFDDDQILPRKLFLALARHMNKADIICPLVFQRVYPYKPVLYKLQYQEKEIEKDGIKHKVAYAQTDQITDYPVNEVFYPDATGFGCVLVSTKLLKAMKQPWFFSNTNLGEDIWFCRRAQEHGFKVLCDTRIKVGHLSIPRSIGELDFIEHNKKDLAELHKDEIEKLKKNIEPPKVGVFGED